MVGKKYSLLAKKKKKGKKGKGGKKRRAIRMAKFIDHPEHLIYQIRKCSEDPWMAEDEEDSHVVNRRLYTPD